jgi:hypothetical protein
MSKLVMESQVCFEREGRLGVAKLVEGWSAERTVERLYAMWFTWEVACDDEMWFSELPSHGKER